MFYRNLRALCAMSLSLITGVFVMQTHAQDLAVGDVAPDFTLAGSDGKQHHLADYRGTAVVLAWFPKAFTGG
jgi:thioredoxin-dependent peroxiredoxin